MCITVTQASERTELELVLAPEPRPSKSDPDGGCQVRRFFTRAEPAALTEFLSEVDRLDRSALVDGPELGIDGIPVLGEIADERDQLQFRAWSPRSVSEPEHHRFVASLHRLASRSLQDEVSRVALEQLHAYLDLGLPLRELGGTPRRIRLFGTLGFSRHAELRQFFENVPRHDPLVMDLSNFEGMGAELFPAFRTFDARPGPTVWYASAAARIQLAYIGIDAARIVDTLAVAYERLLPATRRR
jgi:hypothetical protein